MLSWLIPGSVIIKIPKNPIQTQGPTLSDATLIILTSKNNPVIEVRFKDLFPTSLTGLTYDQQADDVNYLTATVSFEYLNSALIFLIDLNSSNNLFCKPCSTIRFAL